jgi:hypothetical protein
MHRQLHAGLAASLTHMSGLHLQPAQNQRVGSRGRKCFGGFRGLHPIVEADDEGQR